MLKYWQGRRLNPLLASKTLKERWKEISPAHNIRKGMPPAIVFFGSNDKLMKVPTMETFKKAIS